MGTHLPLPKGGEPSLIFGPFLLWPNGWIHQDATWYGGRPRPRRHCIRCRPSSPSCPPQKKGGTPPIFGPYLLGQTAICIRIPVGTEVGLSLGDIVLDGDPARPSLKGHTLHPIFGPCILWPNGWMDEDATWYGSRPRLRPHCIKR